MKFWILLIMILLSNVVIAQEIDEDVMLNQKVPGYVIFQNGDTLLGKVKVQRRAFNQVKVKFYDENGENKKVYKPRQLKGYGYRSRANCSPPYSPVYHWKHFKSRKADMKPVPFTSKNVFMEVKASGRANLYSYYVQSNETVGVVYSHYYYLENTNNSRSILVTKDGFDWAVPAFLEDCKKITTIVETALNYDRLEEIVDIYNNCDKYKDPIPYCDIEPLDLKN